MPITQKQHSSSPSSHAYNSKATFKFSLFIRLLLKATFKFVDVYRLSVAVSGLDTAQWYQESRDTSGPQLHVAHVCPRPLLW